MRNMLLFLSWHWTATSAPFRDGCCKSLHCLTIFASVSAGSVLTMLSPAEAPKEIQDLNAAELGAIAHLYRGEVYRSTIWRTRLDNTTNWSIVTMGIALSTTFSSREASALPLILADDYLHPRHHISFLRAAGRRVRRSYIWLIMIQTSAYFGKLAIHPQMATHLNEFVERAEIGPIPGWVVLCCGFIYNLGWVVLAVATYWLDRRAHGNRTSATAMG